MSYIGQEPTLATYPSETFSGDDATTIFTIDYNAGSSVAIEINISGITQQTSSYTVAGTTLTFTEAPPTGTDNIEVKYRATEGYSIINATEDQIGAVELATQAEVNTGTDTIRVITPATLSNSSISAKAWVNYSTITTTTIRDSYNVSSLTDNGTGDTTINYSITLPSVNYVIALSCVKGASGSNNNVSGAFTGGGDTHHQTTTTARVTTMQVPTASITYNKDNESVNFVALSN